jgi:putative membrane protein
MDYRSLPAINASLNALSAVILITGYALIRNRHRTAHQYAMVSAFAVSVVFLVCYLVYHYQVGSVRFPRTGAIRTVYLSILLTHTILAATVPVLSILTLTRAFQRRFPAHRRIARWTFPIWLYVSLTGVVVYWMLYRM